MKTTFLKTVLPASAFMIAIFSAFAFSPIAENNSESAAQLLGHYKVDGKCEAPGTMCQDDVNTGACQFGSNPLYKKISDTSCATPLWRIVD